MEGIVQTYSSNVLSITMDVKQGSGTFSNWIVNLNKIGDLGHNTFRNNIMVMYTQGGGAGSGFPSFRYDDAVYPSTSTYTNNVFYSLYPPAGTYTNVIQTVGAGGVVTTYTCSTATAGSGTTFGSFSGCQNADPKFVAASPSSWNSPSSFDLRLQSSSPALHAGASGGVPTYDLVGNPFVYPPSIGASESTGPPPPLPPPSSCDINRDGVVNVLDWTAAVNQFLGVTPCGTADLLGNGQCNAVDVERVIIAIMGGSCRIGK